MIGSMPETKKDNANNGGPDGMKVINEGRGGVRGRETGR